MAKVQIKSEKLTPFGGIFSIMEQFDSMISPTLVNSLIIILFLDEPFCSKPIETLVMLPSFLSLGIIQTSLASALA